jgi:UTP--glucose-1-phosphate uridylyltransferase
MGSHKDFKTATTGVAAKAMKNELSRLVNTVSEPAKRVHRQFYLIVYDLLTIITALQPFDTEMQSFFYLFTRYLAERAKGQEMCVSRIKLSMYKEPTSAQ